MEAYKDVELRHAVLHGVGNNDLDLRTNILGQVSAWGSVVVSVIRLQSLASPSSNSVAVTDHQRILK